MKFKLVLKANPINRKEVKWHANPIKAGTKDLKDVAKRIAHRSSLTHGDVENVIRNFIDELPILFMDGFSVQLGDFGTFRLTLSSEGSLTEDKFNTNTIKPRVVFRAGNDIKHQFDAIRYECVHTRKPTSTHRQD